MSQLSVPLSLASNLDIEQVQIQNQTQTQLLVPISTQNVRGSQHNFGLNQDFTFLINIIKNLEKTIEALNKRLEAYKNQTQNDIVMPKVYNLHIYTSR